MRVISHPYRVAVKSSRHAMLRSTGRLQVDHSMNTTLSEEKLSGLYSRLWHQDGISPNIRLVAVANNVVIHEPVQPYSSMSWELSNDENRT